MIIKITNENHIKMLECLKHKNPILLSELKRNLWGHDKTERIIVELIVLDILKLSRNNNKQISLCKDIIIKNYDKLGNLEVEINEEI